MGSKVLELLAEKADQMDKTLGGSWWPKKVKSSRGSRAGSGGPRMSSRRGQRSQHNLRTAHLHLHLILPSVREGCRTGAAAPHTGRGRRQEAASPRQDSFRGSPSGESSGEGHSVPP